jgi:hypothetical protein
MINKPYSLCHINILVFLNVRSTLVIKASSHTIWEAFLESYSYYWIKIDGTRKVQAKLKP